MTPEELEQLPGIGPSMIDKIFSAVNSYYSQYEEQPAPQEETMGEALAREEALAASAEMPSADDHHQPAETPSLEQVASEEEAANAEGADDEQVMDAAFAHLSVGPSELSKGEEAASAASEHEFDTIKDSENVG
jgi:N utilization substance protein A